MRRALVLVFLTFLAAGVPLPATARSSPQGELDDTFGTQGYRVTDMGGTDIVSDVMSWGNRAIVLGFVWHRTGFVARYASTGRLDQTFNRDGRIRLPKGYVAVDAAVTPDDDLFVLTAHSTGERERSVTSLFRYGLNGWLDESFGMGGRIDLPRVNGRAVAVDRKGRILLAGEVHDGATTDGFAVVRLTASGRRDHRFSGDGVATASFPYRADVTDVLVRPSGRVLLVGFGVIGDCSGGGCDTPFLLARFGMGGRPDTSFGRDGRVRGGPNQFCTCGPTVSIDPLGRIVVSKYQFITRLLPRGQPDRTFGDNGYLDLFEEFQSRLIRYSVDATTQSDGRILAVVEGDDSFGRVMRLTVDGRLDTTFGVRGLAPLPATEHRPLLRALALDAGGRILAAGNTVDRQRRFLNVVVTRYT